MKKVITFLIFIATASQLFAQAQRRDTVVLSVYNNNQRFMLYPMPFGKDRPDIDFTATMIVVLDTVHVLKVDTKKDSTGRYPVRQTVERRCGKLPKDSLKGKVALLYINTGCDVSTQVYNAQQLGAIVVIVIHTTDNRDSVELPKQGQNQLRYDDSSKVRIPCFTVRKGIGAKLTMMLPSLVGIQRPRANVNNTQSSAVANTSQTAATIQTNKQALETTERTRQEELAAAESIKRSFTVSPNPTRNQANVTYQFPQTTDATIEVKTAAGQV